MFESTVARSVPPFKFTEPSVIPLRETRVKFTLFEADTDPTETTLVPAVVLIKLVDPIAPLSKIPLVKVDRSSAPEEETSVPPVSVILTIFVKVTVPAVAVRSPSRSTSSLDAPVEVPMIDIDPAVIAPVLCKLADSSLFESTVASSVPPFKFTGPSVIPLRETRVKLTLLLADTAPSATSLAPEVVLIELVDPLAPVSKIPLVRVDRSIAPEAEISVPPLSVILAIFVVETEPAVAVKSPSRRTSSFEAPDEVPLNETDPAVIAPML